MGVIRRPTKRKGRSLPSDVFAIKCVRVNTQVCITLFCPESLTCNEQLLCDVISPPIDPLFLSATPYSSVLNRLLPSISSMVVPSPVHAMEASTWF